MDDFGKLMELIMLVSEFFVIGFNNDDENTQ